MENLAIGSLTLLGAILSYLIGHRTGVKQAQTVISAAVTAIYQEMSMEARLEFRQVAERLGGRK